MKLQLANLIYTTTDPSKIEELKELGAVVVAEDDLETKEAGPVIDDGAKLENLRVEELRALAEEKGLDLDGSLKKKELIEEIQAALK